MKIAVFVESFPHLTQKFIIDQMIYFSARGCEIKLFVSRKNTNNQPELVQNKSIYEEKLLIIEDRLLNVKQKISYITKELFDHVKSTSIFETIVLLKNNFKQFSKMDFHFLYNYFIIKEVEGYDIVHVHFGPMGNYFLQFRERGFFTKPKIIVSFHGLDLHVDDFKKKYEKLFIEAHLITVNSKYSRDIIFESSINHKEKVKLLPIGTDTEFFKPINKQGSNNSFKILFSGRLIKLKGAESAILIIEKLIKNRINKDIKLIIAGDGPERFSLEKMVAEKEISNSVEFKGAVNQLELRGIYGQADLFLFPGIRDPNSNRAEAQGLVIQEAQAMELPVITSKVGGIKYGLIDGVTGFVLDEFDIEGYVEKIMLLIDNEDLRISMGKAGREFVIENYDSILLGEKLYDFYLEALKI
ncbi:glycosyltransferase [Cyclobacteriaceae bacterium YHN15]|nr:glycosyltransferase [Cyclobacteriaceae bacterium YHN15]